MTVPLLGIPVPERLRGRVRAAVRWVFRDTEFPLKGESGAVLRYRLAEQPSLLRGMAKFEPDFRVESAALIQPGDVIFDIGANIGLTVDRFWALLHGRGRIWAFEPLPRNLDLLRRNARAVSASGVEVVTAAVGNYDGEAEFESNVNFGTVARLSDVHAKPDREGVWTEAEKIRVPILRLDTFAQKNPEALPDFMKIDVEGAGHMVLEGGMQLLKRCLPALNVSFHNPEEKAGVRKILRELGYDGLNLEGEGRFVKVPVEKSKGSFRHPDQKRTPR